MPTDNIISRFRPYRSRKRDVMYGLLWKTFMGESNKKKSIYGRASDSLRQLHDSMIFLSGFLTLLPHLGLKRAVQLQHDGEKLMKDADAFLSSFETPSVAKVRKLRVFNEKIVGFIEKVEKDLLRRRSA